MRSAIKLPAEQKFEKGVEAERRSAIKLIIIDEEKSEKARVEVERRTGESSQAVDIRLINKRHSCATRSMPVANRAISNVLVLGRALNVV